jgi:2-polyprenyl-6-hydroxyphenyl methylase/3-demethylubiquinone-9 3-methyltransferase
MAFVVSGKDLKDIKNHFAFGKNWAAYAVLIEEPQLEAATKGLLKLIPRNDFNKRSFLDIGCGSGLHALAAAQLGVSRILAVDIDPDSIAATRALLSDKDITIPWRAESKSVFELDETLHGTFDIVYSWGVLHHTGSMWEGLSKAASLVAPYGLLAIALYRKTYMDPFWKLEKRLYAHAPKTIQDFVKAGYVSAFRLGKLATGGSFQDYVTNYKASRGMDFYHDVHDWLGGYPYETAHAPEVEAKLASLGFKAERVFAHPISIGIFGSRCDEYVYRLVG